MLLILRYFSVSPLIPNDSGDGLNSAAFAVKKLRLLNDVETARLLNLSYFHSIISNGIQLGSITLGIKSIFVLQKRVIKQSIT